MKKVIFFSIVICAAMLSSCKLAIIPKAVNTVNAISLSELNLERKDYVVLNTISAEASVTYTQRSRKIIVKENSGECTIEFRRAAFSQNWFYKKFTGIARLGFLSNDYAGNNLAVTDDIKPEFIARNMAIYRLINACKIMGGDGLIEPIISTNIEQVGARSVVYKTTVSAKVIKITPNDK